MIGKPGKAPCGCPGEHVVGQYVRCLVGCDDDDFAFEVETPVMAKRCPDPTCGSMNTEPYDLGPMYYLFHPGAAIIDYHCIDCGECWCT